MKKIIILLVSFLFLGGVVNAQLNIKSGTNLVVSSGATVVASNGITADNGVIDNYGTIENKGDLVNDSDTLFTSSSTGTFEFNGSSAQEITGDHDVGFYGNLVINNSNNVSITNTSTGANQTIYDTLTFTSGLLILNGFDLTIGAEDPTGMSATSYIQTNDTGTVSRKVPDDGSTNVLFAVGNTNYNPLTLQNAATATADTFCVRVVDNEPSNSSSGHMVDRSWVVEEKVASGSELTVTPQWNSTEELASFTRSNSAVGYTNDNGTTYCWKDYQAASGSDPYTQSGNVFTTVGTFAISDYDYVSINLLVDDETISATECFNAEKTITVPGSGTTVDIDLGASVDFIADSNVVFKPGFHADSGSYVHAYISDTYCGSMAPTLVAADEDIETDIAEDLFASFDENDDIIRVYPNPNTGAFNIDFMGEPYVADLMLLNYHGKPILESRTLEQNIVEMNISTLPRGMYILVIKSDSKIVTRKIIKN